MTVARSETAEEALCRGQDLEEDGRLQEALQAYADAADGGDLRGRSWPASCWRSSATSLEELGDRAAARRVLERAADAGDARAMSNLGVLKAEDDDVVGATALWRSAASAGDDLAVRHLAELDHPPTP